MPFLKLLDHDAETQTELCGLPADLVADMPIVSLERDPDRGETYINASCNIAVYGRGEVYAEVTLAPGLTMEDSLHELHAEFARVRSRHLH